MHIKLPVIVWKVTQMILDNICTARDYVSYILSYIWYDEQYNNKVDI